MVSRKHITHPACLLVLLAQVLLALAAIATSAQAQSPVGYWTFDDGSGTKAADSSGNGHTAALINGVSWTTGKIGDAVSASQLAHQYVTIPAIDLSGTSAVTVTLWANRTYSATGGHALFEATTNYHDFTTGFGFFPDDATCNGIQAALQGNVGYTANCYSQPSSGVWHHLAVVFDKSQTGGDEVKLYVDGVLQTANRSLYASTNTNNFGNNPIYLFSRAGTTGFNSGMVDDLRIYDSALTAEQIQRIYNSARSGSVAGTPLNTSSASGTQHPFTVAGTDPITMLHSGGGPQQNAAGSLASNGSGWQQGFDFRDTKTFVTDPLTSLCVLPTTAYPTTVNGVKFGWVKPSFVGARNRNAKLDARLAGTNFVKAGAATFNVDLPSPGTYNVSLAMGDAGYPQCREICQVKLLDGSTVLATVTGGLIAPGYFYDAKGAHWPASSWPASNASQQVTLAGSRLTVVVGTSRSRNFTPISFLGVTQVSGSPNFSVSASPGSLSIVQGHQGTSTITTTISGGFNGAITLSASGMPSATTVSFNPQTTPTPGSGNSMMTVTVGASTPVGTYPITVTGNGGGIQQTATVTLTVTAPVLVSIAVTPVNPSISAGTQQQFTATGTYSDGSHQDLTGSATWTSSSPAVATISSSGLATAVAIGSTTIQATSASIKGSTGLTVTAAPVLVSIAVTPANASIPAGTQLQFTATGTYSDGSHQDLTNSATWTSSVPSIATISNAGLATGLAVGSTTIQATK